MPPNLSAADTGHELGRCSGASLCKHPVPTEGCRSQPGSCQPLLLKLAVLCVSWNQRIHLPPQPSFFKAWRLLCSA